MIADRFSKHVPLDLHPRTLTYVLPQHPVVDMETVCGSRLLLLQDCTIPRIVERLFNCDAVRSVHHGTMNNYIYIINHIYM